ncbi:MAG: sulfatase-like hydrolase/transferase [Vicinamibacteria bacterium]
MAKRLPIFLVLLVAACANRGTAPAPPLSILLVTIDTLRADRLGAYGDLKARTPILDGLARAGAVFERVYTPVPITLPAHASIMTGLLPPAHGVRGNGAFALGPNIPTLAEAMKASGRRTAAFIGGFPLVKRFGLSRGFDEYDDNLTKAAGVNYEFAERRARDVVAAAQRWLSANPGPVFVWVHLFDAHAPYDPPAEFRTDDLYRDEIAGVDAALGALLSAWDARLGASLVVATSDHGEAFGEHGEWSHSLFVYDTTLHIPLIIRGPGFEMGRRAKAVVGLTDIGATLVEAAGATGALPGASLRGALARDASDRPLYAETLAPRLDFGWSELRSWREGGLKWIRAPKPELYVLDEDPEESRNQAGSDPARSRALDASLSKALSTTGEKSTSRSADAESAERLRSLGYVQGPGGRGSGADPKDNVEVARKIAGASGPFANWADAIHRYRALAALDPDNPLLNMRLADALLRAGQPEASLAFFARVVKAGPSSADPYVGYATGLAQLNRMKDARRVLEQGLHLDPSNAQIHYNLGEIARLEGRLPEARREYEAALSDPVTAARARARLAEVQ